MILPLGNESTEGQGLDYAVSARLAQYWCHDRSIAGQIRDRPLQSGDVVHHGNGDLRGDDPDDLGVLSNQRVLMLLHPEP